MAGLGSGSRMGQGSKPEFQAAGLEQLGNLPLELRTPVDAERIGSQRDPLTIS